MNNILNIINEEINNLNEFAANPLNQKRLNYLKYQIKKNNPDLIVEALRWGGETTYWLIDKKDNNSITYFENNFKTPIGYYEEEDFKKIVDYFTTTAKKYITIKRNFNILKDKLKQINPNIEITLKFYDTIKVKNCTTISGFDLLNINNFDKIIDSILEKCSE